MNVRWLHLGAALLSFLPIFLAQPTQAECANMWAAAAHSPEEYICLAVAASDVVFVGKVVAIGPPSKVGICSVTFSVEHAWKGVCTSSIAITVQCAPRERPDFRGHFGFEIGDEFLIFWSGYPLGECSGQLKMTAPSIYSTDVRPYLKALGPPVYDGPVQ